MKKLSRFALMRFFVPIGIEGQKQMHQLCVKLDDGSAWTLVVQTEGRMIPDDPTADVVNWTLLRCEPLVEEFPKTKKDFDFITGSKIVGQGRFVL